MEIIYFKKKKKYCYICKEIFKNKHAKDKNYHKVRDHYTRKYKDATHGIFNLKYSIPKEISLIFHNESTYDCHFIMKELAKQKKTIWKTIYSFKRKHRKIHNLFSSNTELQNYKKLYPTDCNLLIMQDL